MKKSLFPISVLVLVAIILGLIGYDRHVTNNNAKKYQTTKTEQTAKTETKKDETPKQRIYCIGDSLTIGNDFASYPLTLESLSNSQVIKIGGNQDTSLDLAIRVGRIKIYVNNITIPQGKTPVDVPLYDEQNQPLDVLKSTGTNFSDVTINGIKGTLSYDANRNMHTFTRNEAGKETPLNQLTQVESDVPDFNENDIVVLFSGTYDNQNNLDIYRTITYQRAIINQIKTQKYIVVSLTSRRQNASVRDQNNMLKEEHKDHFLEYRAYLLDHGLADANITPTAQDQQDLNNNYIPSSLLKDDKLNGNDAFNTLLAKQVNQKMIDLQYIKAQN
ncbi:hypothetical protein DW911_01945 [Erysipelatoclostridium sp. AM42-17]|nr:hypothetical protein DWZ53_02005 [Coprobacillus sp. AF33-1AC]RHS96118.1 hypothetical protein DW911_01945 [Erysipelatoclostridium sp. AM42-17]